MTTSHPAQLGLYDPFVHAMVEDPYPVYRQLRDEHPLYHNAQRSFWAVSRFADVQAVARDWHRYSNAEGVDIDLGAQWLGVGDFLDSDPPKHDRIRAALKNAFTRRAMAELEDKVRAQVNALLDPVLERGSGEFVEEIASQLPLAIVFGMFGFPRSDGERLLPALYGIFERVPGDSQIPKAAFEARSALEEYIAVAASQRRRRATDDLLSVIVAAERAGAIVPDEIPGICLLLLTAGWETTSVLATNAMWLLARYPDQRRVLAEQPGRIPAAIEEILRFESPAVQHSRVTTRDVELMGSTVPAGDRVVLIWASANRDERRWVDADRFDVERETKRNLAFGEGIHHCLGAPLARLEGRVIIETILSRCPNFAVGEPERFPGIVVRGISRLPVHFQ